MACLCYILATEDLRVWVELSVSSKKFGTQYLLMVFESFYNPVISQVSCIREWVVGRGGGLVGVGGQAEGGFSLQKWCSDLSW